MGFCFNKPLRKALIITSVALAVLPLCVLIAASHGGYEYVFSAGSAFWRAYGNSLLICAVSMAVRLPVSILGGWGLARYRFPGRTPLLLCCMVLMLLPAQALLLPQYLLLRALCLLDTLWAVILPQMFSPLGTVLLWLGFAKLPRDMLEAAQAEGAGLWLTLTRVALPCCKRELFMFALISLAESWNALEQPMVYINNPQLYPLSVYLSTAAISSPAQRAATCITALAPVALIFAVLIRRTLPAKAEASISDSEESTK